MGLMDTLKQKLHGHGDKTGDAVDKAAHVADEKTGGKHTDQINSGAEHAKDSLRDEDSPQGTGEGAQPGGTPPPPPAEGQQPPSEPQP